MATIKQICRELRKSQTPAEAALWKLLRNRKLEGYKFLRQHPLGTIRIQGDQAFYVADFYCAAEKLVIEADGSIHELRKEYDKNRDEVMQELGLTVLRFKNDEILNNSDLVLEKIVAMINSPRQNF